MGEDREKRNGWEGEEKENRVEEWIRREEGGKSGGGKRKRQGNRVLKKSNSEIDLLSQACWVNVP